MMHAQGIREREEERVETVVGMTRSSAKQSARYSI